MKLDIFIQQKLDLTFNHSFVATIIGEFMKMLNIFSRRARSRSSFKLKRSRFSNGGVISSYFFFLSSFFLPPLVSSLFHESLKRLPRTANFHARDSLLKTVQLTYFLRSKWQIGIKLFSGKFSPKIVHADVTGWRSMIWNCRWRFSY